MSRIHSITFLLALLKQAGITVLLIFLFISCKIHEPGQISTDVLILGGGTGGTAAGIASARTGAKTIIVESGPWLGGMISSAGVSATDGNHQLPSGLWQEFREQLYQVYKGPEQLATGWVSNTQFEPHVADSIFKQMTSKEANLSLYLKHDFVEVHRAGNRIESVTVRNQATNKTITIRARVFIDATELGDLFSAAGIPYDIGMESGEITGEQVGVTESNDIVQDLTWVAILKDYGQGADKTITKPSNYTPEEFDGACSNYYHDSSRKKPAVDAQKMLDYGKLPNGKYMINWPIYGNDTYLNVIEKTAEERKLALEAARQTTLRFVYFIQQQLGYKNLGLAADEFPGTDGLALIPYHREGRRVKGLVRMTINDIANPFTQKDPLYRTGIAVGDYPIDHHHKKNPNAPQHLEFYPVPSFSVPIGVLIPATIDNLVVAEKGISVSNVVNGTTRLQPCVLLTGQSAGVLAALASQTDSAVSTIPIRRVQERLLKQKAFLLPYLDIAPENRHWESAQRIGATGILKGTGIAYKWANQTWFYPDSLVDAVQLREGLNSFDRTEFVFAEQYVSVQEGITIALQLNRHLSNDNSVSHLSDSVHSFAKEWGDWGLTDFVPDRAITRIELAVVLDKLADPFSRKEVNVFGRFINKTTETSMK